MAKDTTIAGDLVHDGEPDWEPLRRLAGMEIADSFMWMCQVALSDGTRLHAYKHYWTRRYVHLSDDGRAYHYVDSGRYRPYPAALALHMTLDEEDREHVPLGVLHPCRGRRGDH